MKKEYQMHCDFSGMSADQVDKLQKRLVSLKKAYIKSIIVALSVINLKYQEDQYEKLLTDIDDIMNDEANKMKMVYVTCMNKVNKALDSLINECSM